MTSPIPLTANLPAQGASGRIPSLDGLRAVSILLVLFGHVAGTQGMPEIFDRPLFQSLGNLGVRFFFVISGFLITQLLIAEKQVKGTVDLRAFYLRRCFRILPAFWCYLAAIAVAGWLGWVNITFRPETGLNAGTATWDFVRALTFTANFHHEYNWYFNHLWSLSVEEQFYLLWPAAFAFSGLIRAQWVTIAVLALAPFARWLTVLLEPASRVAASREFQAVMDALAIGCALAIWRSRGYSRWYRAIAGQRWIPWAGFALVILSYAVAFAARRPAQIIGQSIANFGIASILDYHVQCPGSWTGRVLNTALLRTIGLWSYSLYLWQEPFLYFRSEEWFQHFPVNILLTFVAAYLSYRFVELPFLSFRRKVVR